MSDGRARAYPALGAGIVGVSFAAIFIRLADAPPAAVAALRLVFTTVLLAPAAAFDPSFRQEIARLDGRDRLLIAFSGLMLALHFALWITSLAMTGVASSVVFVTTNPLFVTLFSIMFFEERVPRVFWAGLALAAAGAAVIGWGDIPGARVTGDLLAIGGAIAAAAYFLVGGRVRRRVSLLTYVVPVYAVAAVCLVVFAAAMSTPLVGHEPRVYVYCLLMAVVSQIGGHTLFNWALGRLGTRIVAAATIGEPVGASLLAFLFLKEVPGAAGFIGGGLILAGLYVSIALGGAAPDPAITGRR